MEPMEKGTVVRVKCDAPGCDWNECYKEFGQAEVWHGKMCPKCGAGPILDDDELALIKLMGWAAEGLPRNLFEADGENGDKFINSRDLLSKLGRR